jgi:hypothetical protein
MTLTFHAHLDQCQQCRDHPHQLCPEGLQQLLAAGGWTMDTCRICGSHIGWGPPAEHLRLCDKPSCQGKVRRKYGGAKKRRVRQFYRGRR